MIIHYERTGGFAGMRMEATIDTEKLPPAEAQILENELASADFFNLPAKTSSPGPGADRFTYRITVESGDRSHTVEAGEASAPERLLPLIERLNDLARSARGS
jgi:hypothetical protein